MDATTTPTATTTTTSGDGSKPLPMEEDNGGDDGGEDDEEGGGGGGDDPQVVADRYKEKGNQHYRQGQYEEAIRCYTRAIETYPQSSVFYCNRYEKLPNKPHPYQHILLAIAPWQCF